MVQRNQRGGYLGKIQTLSPDHNDDKQKEVQNDHHRHLWYVSEIPTRSNGFGGRLNVMRRVDIVCTESSGSTEVTGTSDGIVSLAEGCVHGTWFVSCSCTDISSSVLTGRLGGTK